MKMIMTALGTATLLAAAALSARADTDVAELVEEVARAARPAATEIVREPLAVRCKNQITIRKAPEIPSRKNCARKKALPMAWRKKYDQPRNLSTFHRFQTRNN